jgi:hypothetical protein
MLNGFLGLRDESGLVVEPGWQGCGYACESTSPLERTYEALRVRN